MEDRGFVTVCVFSLHVSGRYRVKRNHVPGEFCVSWAEIIIRHRNAERFRTGSRRFPMVTCVLSLFTGVGRTPEIKGIHFIVRREIDSIGN